MDPAPEPAAPDTVPPAADGPVTAVVEPAACAPPPAPLPLTPVSADQRIEALDVVRGFALLGIFLMNIEWFSRPIATMDEGLPRGLTGLDWLATWFVNYFVAGKFWTIFSLLFGMGFAVMLVRAERAGRAFTKVYLRRILALAVFGAAHYIYLWDGDILFSYAVAALALLILLYGKAKPILIAIAVIAAVGAIADAERLFGVASGLATIGLLALYLRGTKRFEWRGVSMPLFSFLLLLASVVMAIAAVVFWLLPDGPIEPRWPLTVLSPVIFLLGWLSWKYYEPAEKRSLRMAVVIYLFGGVVITITGLVRHFAPDPAAEQIAAGTPAAISSSAATSATAAISAPLATITASPSATVAAAPSSAIAAAPSSTSATAGDAAANAAPASTTPADKPKTRAERAAKIREERAEQLRERAAKIAEETRIHTTGTYLQAVERRARAFPEKVAEDAGFSVVLVAMFLMGVWFVRSGVMENTAAHRDFFRALMRYGLPIGIGLGVLTGFVAVSHTPGDRYDGWVITRGLLVLGNLPACLGYVGLVVTMLHSPSVLSRIKVLAPAGRMALTTYLTQSLICTTFFYGYGLGQWGMSRSAQVLFVLGVFAAQVAFSHWWLARFRYGPMEWAWRGFTYRQMPPMRIAPKEAPAASAVT